MICLTLKSKFDGAIFDSEPGREGLELRPVPFMVISFPDDSPEVTVMDNTAQISDLSSEVRIVLPYEERSEIGVFAGLIKGAIRDNDDNFRRKGFMFVKISYDGMSTEIHDKKMEAVGTFTIDCGGAY